MFRGLSQVDNAENTLYFCVPGHHLLDEIPSLSIFGNPIQLEAGCADSVLFWTYTGSEIINRASARGIPCSCNSRGGQTIECVLLRRPKSESES